MKFTNTVWFWVLQLFGWGLFVAAQKLNEVFNVNYPAKYYVILYCFATLFFGVFCSTLLRFYLKAQLSFDQYKKKEIIQIGVAYIVTSVILSLSFFITDPIRGLYVYTLEKFDKTTFLESLFASFLVLFFWLFFYFMIKNSRQINENKLERLELETGLKEAQLNTLKGQINPHFMFNSLNNIKGLIREDAEKSREMITRLSEMLRYSLTKNDIDTIALENELKMVENYIALSKIHLEDRLVFKKEIPEHLLDTKVPPMLIQMLVENAVKHGISDLEEGGVVSLIIFDAHDGLEIRVTNTGTINNSKNTTKIGVGNIEKRLRLLYQEKAEFLLSENNNLVTALIKIPFS